MVVLIDLSEDGPLTSFELVGPSRGVNDEGIYSVAPWVVDHRVGHQGGLEFLLGQMGLLGHRAVGVPGVPPCESSERCTEHQEVPDMGSEEIAEADD